MKVALIGRPIERKVTNELSLLFEFIESKEWEVIVYSPFEKFIVKNDFLTNFTVFDTGEELKGCDLIICIGGDGTFLETSTLVQGLNIPVIAINAGRLGFLATIQINEAVEALKSYIEGDYEIDERILVKCESEPDIFGPLNFGVNEFAIQKRDTSSMITIHTYINGEFLNSYWADGLIISTPTGSTGYSLSCGGPLVMPQTNNFVISPVNPHNLNVRPMIVPDNSEITFKVEGRAKKILVSLDSRSKSVVSDVSIRVLKADFRIRMVKLTGANYFNTLRNKLNWGQDARN